MSQRNPLNQRYQGDGPSGQTRKSAASVKPSTEAASSVYVKSKPSTAAERKAAEKARKAKLEQKATERARKAARAAQAARTAEAKARLARGEISAEELAAEAERAAEAAKPKKKGLLAALLPSSKAAGAGSAVPGAASAQGSQTGQAAEQSNALRDNSDYRRWRRYYWICLGLGLVCVFSSFALQALPGPIWIGFMVPAYAFVIVAFIIDFKKVKPIMRTVQRSVNGPGKSPKQIKHELEAKAEAAKLEEARKAAKAAKKKRGLLGGRASAATAGADDAGEEDDDAGADDAAAAAATAQAVNAAVADANDDADAAAAAAAADANADSSVSSEPSIGAPAEISDAFSEIDAGNYPKGE